MSELVYVRVRVGLVYVRAGLVYVRIRLMYIMVCVCYGLCMLWFVYVRVSVF